MLKNEILEKLKEKVSGKGLVSESPIVPGGEAKLDVLQKLKDEFETDDLKFAELIKTCYDLLIMFKVDFDSEKLNEYLKTINISDLRQQLNEYNDGTCIGNYMNKEKIKGIINKYREEYIDLINTFFKIFGREG